MSAARRCATASSRERSAARAGQKVGAGACVAPLLRRLRAPLHQAAANLRQSKLALRAAWRRWRRRRRTRRHAQEVLPNVQRRARLRVAERQLARQAGARGGGGGRCESPHGAALGACGRARGRSKAGRAPPRGALEHPRGDVQHGGLAHVRQVQWQAQRVGEQPGAGQGGAAKWVRTPRCLCACSGARSARTPPCCSSGSPASHLGIKSVSGLLVDPFPAPEAAVQGSQPRHRSLEPGPGEPPATPSRVAGPHPTLRTCRHRGGRSPPACGRRPAPPPPAPGSRFQRRAPPPWLPYGRLHQAAPRARNRVCPARRARGRPLVGARARSGWRLAAGGLSHPALARAVQSH